MNSIIFWSVAEYCDCSSKLTIKHKDRQIRSELWISSTDAIQVETKTFFTKRRAYKEYKIAMADAILGGWKVLNALPQRETWETKRSK
jgi:hypothetical protein